METRAEDSNNVYGRDGLGTEAVPMVPHLWVQQQSLEMRDGLLYRRYVPPDDSLCFLQVVMARGLWT